MADNSSLVGGESLRQINDRVIIVQVLVMIFLCINSLLIMTFFKKECFYTTTRYILFALTLLSDSMILLLTDFLLIMNYFGFTMQVGLCIVICFMLYIFYKVTSVTLTAMTLERYVAICMPLRHGELCSTRNTFHCILIIHGLSSVPCIVILSTLFASVSLSFYSQFILCSMEMFLVHKWQDHLMSAINQFYFLIMIITIVFCYVKIMKVAKVASGENKKSTSKGLRTVLLHGFQLVLCLIQLWCPLIESAILQIDLILFIQVRYFNHIIFGLAPRCLSPLIYGLRDEKFFLELKSYTFFSLYRKRNLRTSQLVCQTNENFRLHN
uniref:G-protein coupled receptors family 1 profile domain-containing protein n=1 Tax=Lates calcarifer TaxID=8187 RepID=A0A4W6DRQ8_LATCA